MVALAHEDHQGMVRSKLRARELFWWPKMDGEVERAMKSCEVCAALDKMASAFSTPLQPVLLPESAWDKVGLDFIGRMQAPGQQCYAVVPIESGWKWVSV